MTAAPAVRCAIYTRKSSDEGLDQAFNSLHAQREACAAYVSSQMSLGWTLSADRYDDGAYSGASMNRPALRRLLADVAARRVDAILVYKVDRLTRSLADFARIIETLERAKVAFVSVTQQFSTSTSMGRLTLNVLLSFAQFEREVTGERIRDKIAASKAKGMWMGGTLPLGYDLPDDRSSRALSVNPEEARTVRAIFAKFIELGSTGPLQAWLDSEGCRSKRWVTASGRTMGGYRFSRGALRHLLSNRTYVGEIPHRTTSYPGRHQAIIDASTFDAAQALLAASSRRRRERVSVADQQPLAGILFDGEGQPMAPVVCRQRRRTYRYYVSATDVEGLASPDGGDAIRRLPAEAVESLIFDLVKRILDDDGDPGIERVQALIGRVEVHAASVQVVLRIGALQLRASRGQIVEILRSRLRPEERLLAEPSHLALLRITLPTRLVVRGGRTWQSGPAGRPGGVVRSPERQLVRALQDGHRTLKGCGIAPGTLEPSAWRTVRAPKTSHQRWRARLALLAPDLQLAILRGEIVRSVDDPIWQNLPLCWTDQRRLLMPAAMAWTPVVTGS
jgi:site-specific DNA recombinase